ncbi:class I SAM-dependent methyltransferase [Paenibacillus sp. PSB04]|uniref:class I SAM-dependent methyltransferase n=1 Tax=Paenibacillus sp. PSB04 TaxID=2866810 RepID=UPI0021F193E6|nr:class I SAM-dependent methyltransferase [Paenibacillus sp. PSB04]UYO05190.1 class I SAM-dependent methyltransferase [Paenibacillus sp. PSB04]
MTDNLIDLGKLYHDYSIFGIHNHQLDGLYKLNQKSKEPIIRAYMQYAIAKCRSSVCTPVNFVELFCADGYYAMLARHLGATFSTGIDNNKDGHFFKAEKIAERLGINNIEFILEDINEIDNMHSYDIVANVGGLYHVENPKEILVKSYSMARKYLIIQSVVSLSNHDENYLEIPAPGWSWGNRMNPVSFHKMILDLDYQIVDFHLNELEGNGRIEDRGSVYYLIKVEPEKNKEVQR